MEWTNTLDFPKNVKKPLEALHMAFLGADEGDDPQFRLDRSEVARLAERTESCGSTWTICIAKRVACDGLAFWQQTADPSLRSG